jgi:hypothetical protein
MQKWEYKSRRTVFYLLVSVAICAGAVLCSCRGLGDSKQTQPRNLTPRNLTPGLSEALTALSRRHPHAGFILLLTDRSGNSEEAKNLAALMEKALKVGGWKVVRNEVKSDPIHGLYCSYGRSKEQAATELISVLEQKGLLIKGFMHDDDPALGRGGDPTIVLEVGLNQ